MIFKLYSGSNLVSVIYIETHHHIVRICDERGHSWQYMTVYLRTTVHDQEGMIENVLIVIDEILKHHQSQSIINQFIFF